MQIINGENGKPLTVAISESEVKEQDELDVMHFSSGFMPKLSGYWVGCGDEAYRLAKKFKQIVQHRICPAD